MVRKQEPASLKLIKTSYKWTYMIRAIFWVCA